jgi:hypothetical protein
MNFTLLLLQMITNSIQDHDKFGYDCSNQHPSKNRGLI